MAETPSTMLPLGTLAPDFSLRDVRTDLVVSLHNTPPTLATVIMFLCNHCPYVKHIQKDIVHVAKQYQEKGIRFIAISSNDAKKYPADSPEKMREEALNAQYSFPYLYDETQAVAKAYQAACTPDFFVFDKELKCVYRGRFDEATPGNNKRVTGKDLTAALDDIVAGRMVNPDQRPSLGCNIKWV